MPSHENETGSWFFEAVGADTARDLLALCVEDRSGGFPGLCARLEAPGGGAWAERVLAEARVGEDATGLDVVMHGAGGAAGPARLKHLGKKAVAASAEPEDEARAMLLYLCATAAGLAHGAGLISTRDPRVLIDLLADLEPRLPASLRETFRRAIEALRGILSGA